MSLELQKNEDGRYSLNFVVPAEKVKELMKDVYREIKKDVAIPGFRRGKVPFQIGAQYYGETLYFRALNRVIYPCFMDFIENQDEVKMLGTPEFDLAEELKVGEDVNCIAIFDVFPEVELGQYTALTVPTVNYEPTEEDVEKVLRQTQERNSRLVTVTDRGAELGDLVNFSYTATVDGQPFEGGEDKNAFVDLGTRKSEFEGLEDGLLGVKQGDHKVVTAQIPELDKYPEEVRGKEAQFDCEILSVQYHEYPELDDEFAEDVSSFDTLEEYKADLAKQLKERNEAMLKEQQTALALSQLIQNCKVEIPKHFLDENVKSQVDRMTNVLASNGLKLEEYLMGTAGKNVAQYEEEIRNELLTNYSLELIFQAIAEKENMEVTEEEIQQFIDERAAEDEKKADQVRARYATEEGLKDATMLVKMNKARDLVLSTLIEEEMAQEPVQE